MIANFIQSLHKQELHSQTLKRTFQPGQIFQGRVAKLFPNQIAEVLVGNHKLLAKLEIPLLAGERYWFQVQKGEGKVHLKVLSVEDSGNGSHSSSTGLLKQLNLANTKENKELINFFLKEKLPLTKDLANAASLLMKDVNQGTDELTALKELISKNLPITKDTFAGVLSNIKNVPIHELIHNLQSTLGSQPNHHQKLLSVLNDLLLPQEQKLSEKVVNELLRLWLHPQGGKDSQLALGILQKLSFVETKDEIALLKQAALGLIKDGSIISTSSNEVNRLKLALEQGQGKLVSLFVKQTLSSVIEEGMYQSRNILSILAVEENLPSMTSLLNERNLQRQESVLLNNLIQGEEAGPVQWDKGKSVADHLKALIGKMGIDYENSIIQLLKEGNQQDIGKIDTLKALLLKVIAEEAASPIRESSEQLLNRITGIQLQSQESSPLQQYVMQVPISFWNKTTDLTVQWSGRKKENGQIDPDYCRVLFYLELEHLNEVVVDMQIQNRIMNLTIINDTEEIKELSEGYIEVLKTNLHELGFSLSHITFQSTLSHNMPGNLKRAKQTYDSSQYSGVDIRI